MLRFSLKLPQLFAFVPNTHTNSPPKPPSDFIKNWINVLRLKPRLFLSNKGTAKICPLCFLPCVPVPATPSACRQVPRSPLLSVQLPARCQQHSLQNENSAAVPQVSLHHGLGLHRPNPSNPSGSSPICKLY